MTDHRDPITEHDLDSYVDEQLTADRRIEVEAYLSMHPETAARVMADLRMRDELRLSLADGAFGLGNVSRFATMDAARKLERGLQAGRWFQVFQRAAAVAVFVGTGWVAHGAFGPLSVTSVNASSLTPPYVADAIQAHRTTLVRASMNSQISTQDYDAVEIRSATGILMPKLPAEWRVQDVQVYPSQFGPSVEIAVDAEGLGPMSLFAVRPGSFDVVGVTLDSGKDTSAAYWQIGEVAYALVGKTGVNELDHAAATLADTLY
ncbi:anti-sigma factor family protein [Limoniibacter endophyticus]|uniref:Transcriptional regulator (Anti-sigma factor) n=1 Tax=Limoniibacter endophyticus TaxID=1565040 RepID=A0A8J3GII8_9HYPH|nr:anti-sigma factor [Limoniibacter endophyticus]GHC77616.1 transcriptional regulator (anti-sigma factor) [Limoniibacter endophyticus]